MQMAISIGAIGLIFILIITAPVCAFDGVRSGVYNLSQKEVTFDGRTFPGFYYDIDENTVADKLSLNFSDINPDGSSAVLSDEPDANGSRGVVYTTSATSSTFGFKPWGKYKWMRFFSKNYLVAYDNNMTRSMIKAQQSGPFLYDKSSDSNLMTNDQISQILIDEDDEYTISSSKPLKLKEGYKLAIKNIDQDGKKVYLELSKDGQVVDYKVIEPEIENASMEDKTYYYKRDLGDTKDIVIIAVHFKSIFAGYDMDSAKVDGIFQISDKPLQLKANQHYGKISLQKVDPTSLSIRMDNKDNKITLSNDKDIPLMYNIYIHTADQDISAGNPLRYYLYEGEIIEDEAPAPSAVVVATKKAESSGTMAKVAPAAETIKENATSKATEAEQIQSMAKTIVPWTGTGSFDVAGWNRSVSALPLPSTIWSSLLSTVAHYKEKLGRQS